MFLIRFILLVILFSVLLRIIGRLLFSFHRGKQNDRQSGYFEKKKKEEGKVTVVINTDKKKKIIHKNEGEYIHYEEISK